MNHGTSEGSEALTVEPGKRGSLTYCFASTGDHHDGAVAMARVALRKQNIALTTRSFAQEIVLDQQREIGIMDTFLTDWGNVRGDPDRLATR